MATHNVLGTLEWSKYTDRTSHSHGSHLSLLTSVVSGVLPVEKSELGRRQSKTVQDVFFWFFLPCLLIRFQEA